MLNFKQELRSQAFKPFVCDLFLAFWRAEGMQCCQSKADKEAKPKWQTEVLGNICLTLNLCIGWKGFGCFLELGRESSWFFFLLFTWALANSWLLSHRCCCSALAQWQHVAHRLQDCFGKKLGQMASLLDCYSCQGSALKQVSFPFNVQCICDFRLLTLHGVCVFSVFSPLCHMGSPKNLECQVSLCLSLFVTCQDTPKNESCWKLSVRSFF